MAWPSELMMKSTKSWATSDRPSFVTMLKGRATLYVPLFTFSAVASTPSTSTAFTVSFREPKDM